MKKVMAWTGALITLYFMYIIFNWLSNSTGVPFVLDDATTSIVNYGRGVEFETDNSITDVGYIAIIIGLMISFRVGLALNYGNIKGGMSSKEIIGFWIWLQGLFVLLVMYIIIGQAFRKDSNHGLISKKSFLEITTLIGVFVVFKQIKTKKLKNLEKKENMTNRFHILTTYKTRYGTISTDGYYEKHLSSLTGFVADNGEVYRYTHGLGKTNKILVGTVDKEGRVRDVNSTLVGIATGDGKILDQELKHVGWVGRLTEDDQVVIYNTESDNLARGKGAAARLLLDHSPDEYD